MFKTLRKSKIFNLFLIIIVMVINRLRILKLLIISETPWFRALQMTAWNLYKQSELFRQRWIEFSPTMAAKLYSIKEHMFFIEKVKQDKELVKKILYHPYQILNDETEYDYELRMCVKF